MARVYLGVGSNLGNKVLNCRTALEHLERRGVAVTRQSSLYETEPWGVEDQPRFVNMAIEAETSLTPEQLLAVLKDVERMMGRVQTTARYGPRVIDLDILLCDDRVISKERLKVPHPLLHQRDFVLLPLSEIAGDVVHPVLKKTIGQLKEELDAHDGQHPEQIED